MKGIWQDLVDEHGFTASYECVKRFTRKIQPPDQPAPHPRIETEPGLESQVDYGDGPWVRDLATGKYRRSRIFAMTLGHSRRSVWLLTLTSSTQTWCRLHEQSFRRLGGTTRTVVLDNLKEGVIKPDVYDPALNPLYRDLLAHYGVVAIPARVRDPNRKGKVESAIGFAQKRLRGMRFESLAEAQAYLDRWSERWADTRIHGTTKRQVAAVFQEIEKPALQPLPVEPFRYYEFGTRTVHLDGCVQVASAFYSAPPSWLGRKVHIQWCDRLVRILDPHTSELLREHTRQPPGHHRVHRDDRGKRHPESIEYHLQRAEAAGPHVGALCRKLQARSGKYAVRHILGVLSLAKSRGHSVVDKACQIAVEAGAPTYRFVKRYMEHQRPPPPLEQVNDLIRDLSHYRDLFEQRTEQHNEQDRARSSPAEAAHVGHGRIPRHTDAAGTDRVHESARLPLDSGER